MRTMHIVGARQQAAAAAAKVEEKFVIYLCKSNFSFVSNMV